MHLLTYALLISGTKVGQLQSFLQVFYCNFVATLFTIIRFICGLKIHECGIRMLTIHFWYLCWMHLFSYIVCKSCLKCLPVSITHASKGQAYLFHYYYNELRKRVNIYEVSRRRRRLHKTVVSSKISLSNNKQMVNLPKIDARDNRVHFVLTCIT